MKTRPNIIKIGEGVYRLDLRSKSFERFLQTISGGKKCLDFQKRVDAEKKADEVEELLTHYGTKKLETLEVVMRVDPLDLQARLEPFGKTIQDAVNFYVNYLTEQQQIETSQIVEKLMDEWLLEKKRRVDQKTLRKDTYITLYYKVNGENGYKAQWGKRPVASITTKEIRDWIESRQVKLGDMGFTEASQVSKKHQLSYLSQFFHWCKRSHGVPKENPCEPITIAIDEDAGAITFFSVEEATAIMTLATTKKFVSLIPYLSICLFSGVRAAECERLTWDSIDFENRSIVLMKGDAKTFARRVEIQPNLLTWLQWFKSKYPQYPLIPAKGFDDRNRKFRKKLNLACGWPKNALRHSAASYTLGAKIGDFGYLEENFGNSRQMLQKHYLNYPSKEDSLKFWKIMPPTE